VARLQPPDLRSRRRSLASILALLGVFAAIVVIAGVTIINRIESGRWEVPSPADFERIVDGRPRPASKTILLERRPMVLRPGVDDAPRGVSSVLARAGGRSVRLEGWAGSDAAWAQVVTCVRALFAPFAVVVTDERPLHHDFVLVAVGGRPADVGLTTRGGGLAPFTGDVIPTPVVFAFSAALAEHPRTTCETIAREVGHAYGLDHSYACEDAMSHLPRCGPRQFVDAPVRCGERRARPCEGGAATQNSFRRLARVLGTR
jgi:hypothetical protein